MNCALQQLWNTQEPSLAKHALPPARSPVRNESCCISLYRDTVKVTPVAEDGSRGMNVVSEFLMGERLSP